MKPVFLYLRVMPQPEIYPYSGDALQDGFAFGLVDDAHGDMAGDEDEKGKGDRS